MPEVVVSDHAIVRYLERVGGFDVERLRRQIAEMVAPVAKLGGSGMTRDGLTYVINHNDDGTVVVTTVVPKRTRATGLTSTNHRGQR